MKKFIAFILALSFLCLTFSACGGKDRQGGRYDKEYLMSRFVKPLYNCGLLMSPHDAEDLSADALLNIYRANNAPEDYLQTGEFCVSGEEVEKYISDIVGEVNLSALRQNPDWVNTRRKMYDDDTQSYYLDSFIVDGVNRGYDSGIDVTVTGVEEKEGRIKVFYSFVKDGAEPDKVPGPLYILLEENGGKPVYKSTVFRFDDCTPEQLARSESVKILLEEHLAAMSPILTYSWDENGGSASGSISDGVCFRVCLENLYMLRDTCSYKPDADGMAPVSFYTDVAERHFPFGRQRARSWALMGMEESGGYRRRDDAVRMTDGIASLIAIPEALEPAGDGESLAVKYRLTSPFPEYRDLYYECETKVRFEGGLPVFFENSITYDGYNK